MLLADPRVLIESLLSLSLAVAVAALGVRTINSLRDEAYGPASSASTGSNG